MGPRARLSFVFLTTLGVAGCARPGAKSESVEQLVEKRAAKAEVVVAPKVAEVPAPRTPPYADALRRREFDRAAFLLDAAESEEGENAEWLYARALVAAELRETKKSLELLDKLLVKPRGFEREAASLRERVLTESGDIALLRSLGPSTPERSLALAAALLEKGLPEEAESEAKRSLNGSFRSPKEDITVRAHELLARSYLARDRSLDAAKEYAWLALNAPTSELSKGAWTRAFSLNPSFRPKSKDVLSRCEKLADNGQLSELEETLDWLRKAGPGPETPERLALRARAVYQGKSDYVLAAELFGKAAKNPSTRRDEYRYYEAKSLARAHKDSEALVAYARLSSGTGTFSDHAAYQSARLALYQGDYDAAVRNYEKYNKKFRKRGLHLAEVADELPLAHLGQKQFVKAEYGFRALLGKVRDPQEHALLLELIALSLDGSGKKAEALAAYRAVNVDRPLSLPALLARAHIGALGEPVPPALESAQTATLLPLSPPVLPDKVARLSRVGLDDQAEAALRDLEPILRQTYAPRAGEALCELYGQLESARRRFQLAQTEARAEVLRREITPETRWQADCLFPRPYAELVEHNASTFGVDEALVYGVMRQESAFHPGALSPAAAVGLMQIIPKTASRIADELGVPETASLLRSPYVNIRFGSFYLKKLMDTFRGRSELAAAAYNAGPNAVFRWLRLGGEEPTELFVAKIPYDETRNYVLRVVGNTARYAYLEGGEPAVPKLELLTPKDLSAPSELY